jgi:hypothetical protein
MAVATELMRLSVEVSRLERLITASVPERRLRGYARSVRERDLPGVGIPFKGGRGGPWLETTSACDTKKEALEMAEQQAKKYQNDYWPGGMAEVVALVEFPDQPNEDGTGGLWVGVVNQYYSNS